MDEELIELKTEESVDVEVEEVVTSEIHAEDSTQSTETTEFIQTVEVETVEEMEIEIEETIGWVGGDNTRHYSLYGRDEPDQHPITSITGLRTELDNIEALQTVYSDKKQQADYYMWYQNDVEGYAIPTHPYGLFVSFHPNTDKIQICDGARDVFGITVSEAAFVGNQEYVQAIGGAKTGRDGNYVLVTHSGLVDVRCETTVVVGDYVAPNNRGEAKKTERDYGYLVIALKQEGDIQYARISLNMPSTLTKNTADSVKDLNERMRSTESNVTSVTDVANSAYVLALDAKENANVNAEYIQEKIEEVIGKMDAVDVVVGNLSESVTQATGDAELAKKIAENAVSEARQMGDDAYASANEAIAAIKDMGAGSTSWAKRLDAYSVGEYSQGYGLTLEQAKSALPIGIIHVPTVAHIEVYVGESEIYEQEFTIGYYYEWNGEKWSPSYSTAVNFSSVYIEGTIQSPYWVVTVADVEYNGVIYKLGYLYKWETVAWSMTGACVTENTLTRAVSAMKQAANELSMEITNARGDAASLNIRLDKDKSVVQNLARWTGSEEGKYNIATSKFSVNDEGASATLVVVKDGKDEELGGARIVLNDSEKGSYIQMDADRINFTAENFDVFAENIGLNGYVIFKDAEANGTTTINGMAIKTGTIDADKINVNNLSAISADLGVVKAGAIQSSDYVADTDGFKLSCEKDDNMIDSKYFKVTQDGEILAKNANIEGNINATTGHIGTLNVDADGTVSSANGGFTVSSQGLLSAKNANIEGRIEATDGKIGGFEITSNGFINPEHLSITSESAFFKAASLNFGNNVQMYSEIVDGETTVHLVTDGTNNFEIRTGTSNSGLRFEAQKGEQSTSIEVKLSNFRVSLENPDFEGAPQAYDNNLYIDYTLNDGNASFHENRQLTVYIKYDVTKRASWTGGLTIDRYDTRSINFTIPKMSGKGTFSYCLAEQSDLFTRYGQNLIQGKFSDDEDVPYAATTNTFIPVFSNSDAVLLKSLGSIFPVTSATNGGICALGDENNVWKGIVSQGCVEVVSDRTQKHDIIYLSTEFEKFYDDLKPVSFKYNYNESNRTHIGFIAQDVEDSLNNASISTKDFAGICISQNPDTGDKKYFLRYEEFIPLNTYEIQKLKKRVEELEQKLNKLQTQQND